MHRLLLKRRPYTAGIISPMGLGTIPPFQKRIIDKHFLKNLVFDGTKNYSIQFFRVSHGQLSDI